MRLRSNYGRRKSFISFYREERERETLMTIVLLISSAKFCCSAPDTLVTGFISPNDAYNGVTYTELLVELDLPRKEPRADVKNFSPSFLPSPTTVLQRRPAICSRRCTITILPHEQPFPSTSLFTSDLSYGNTPYSLIDTPNRFPKSLANIFR